MKPESTNGREMSRLHTGRSAKITALFLLVALLLSACSSNSQLSLEDALVQLPEPEPVQRQQILGDNSLEGEAEIDLHFASDNSMSLNTVTRRIRHTQDQTLIESVLQELLEGTEAIKAGIIGSESSSGAVTVNLSLEASVNRSEQDYLLLCTSIANTLLELEGINAVNILTGGRSDSLCGLPLGAFVQPQDNVAAVYAQVHSESERFPSENQDGIFRNVLLYFPSEDGKYLLSEVRELEFSNDDYVSAIVNALTQGPLMRACSFSPIPANIDLLASAPLLKTSEAGERIIELNFSGMLTNYLEFAAVQPWQLYGSLVLTLCSFVPEIDALRICIEGEPISECSLNGQELIFADGLMRRTDFTPAIGSTVRLYFPNSENHLTAIETPISQAAAYSALTMVRSLFAADFAPEHGLISPFPEGIVPEDILGIEVENGIAEVNLSARFYSRCQNLNALQERLMVYSMVNTLSGIEQIGAVRFLVEGNTADKLAQEIYLNTALMPDLGLIQPLAANLSEIKES